MATHFQLLMGIFFFFIVQRDKFLKMPNIRKFFILQSQQLNKLHLNEAVIRSGISKLYLSFLFRQEVHFLQYIKQILKRHFTMINSIQFQGLSISSMSSFLKRIPVQKQYQSYLKKLNQNQQRKSKQTDVKKSVCNFLIVQPPGGLRNSEQNNEQKRLIGKEMDLNYDQKEYRLIRRRIDKQIKFDLFYYCLLEYFCNKKQAEKKRKEITLQKNHRSVVSLFVLFKLVVKQKKGQLDLDELREKVEKRIENKYQYCARNFRTLLTNQLEIIFSALELFLSQREMEAIQKVYTSRQTNKNIMSKMERCKEIISEEKKYS